MSRLAFLLPLCLAPWLLAAQPYLLASPNSQLRLTVQTNPDLNWQLQRRDQPLTLPAPISLTLNSRGGTLGKNPVVQRVERNSVDRMLRPPVRQKSATVPER